MKVVWTTQLGGRTGCTPQSMLIAEKLRDRGIEVALMHTPPLGIEHDAPYIETELENGVTGIYPVKGVAEAAEAWGPDVVVIHNFNMSVVQDLSRLRANYPVLLRLGINLLELLTLPQYHEIIPSVVSTILCVDQVIAASRNTAMQVRAMGKGDVTVIPTVVDPARFERHGRSPDPMVTCMGRIYPVKNHITLIQAFNLVKSEIPEAELAIAGAGEELPPVLSGMMNAMGLKRGVDYKFTGHMTDLDLLFRETRVLCLPSFSENLPQSVLEAYASGVPCVVSDCGWGRAFQAALKARHDSPQEFAEQIYALLTSEAEWNVVRERQFRELEERFSLGGALDKYEKLISAYHETESYLARQEESVKNRLRELGVRVRVP